MSTGIFSTLVTRPLYNGIVFLLHVVPGLDLGLAVILFTVLIRLLLFPLAQRALQTQLAMQEIQPELEHIKEEYKNDREQQASRMMALYKNHGVNPFASFLFLLIQLPIIFGLYRVFLHAGFPVINNSLLYSFVIAPQTVSTLFLGFLDVTQKSLLIAILAGVSQFFQSQFMKTALPKTSDKQSFGADFAKSMSFQMKYIFPVLIVFIAYALPASISLYWITSNIVSIAQELYLRNKVFEKR